MLWAVLALTPVVSAGKVGTFEWDETLSGSVEYNSNITTSEADPVEDVVVQARFAINGEWEMTRTLALAYGLGIGYRRYIGNSGFAIDNAAIQLVPDTQFEFDVRLSDNITLKVADTLDFTENASDITVFNRETGRLETDLFSFERISNRASIDGSWSINKRNKIGVGVWRADVIPLASRFKDYRRIQHGLNGTWTRSLNASLRAGVTGSVYSTRYETDLNNDSEGHSWGPFFEYGVTENLTFRGGLSWVRTSFDRDDQLPGVEDQFQYSNAEWSLRMNHAFNPKMSYSVEYRHSSDYGYISNFRTLDTASATFAWKATRTGEAQLSTSYEGGDDSGGLAPERWERFFISVGYGQPIWRDFEISARVRWTDKQSEVAGRSFEQFTFYIGLVYHFPRY